MANHENLSTPFIYLRSTGENISVTKEQRDAFYKEADRIRHKEQHHHRCMCSKKHLWECDGNCIACKYHAAGDTLSLDIPIEDGEANIHHCRSLRIFLYLKRQYRQKNTKAGNFVL